jgi:hypothetical protein
VIANDGMPERGLDLMGRYTCHRHVESEAVAQTVRVNALLDPGYDPEFGQRCAHIPRIQAVPRLCSV